MAGWLVSLIFGLFFFAACTTGEQSNFTLADAESAGLIMSQAQFEDAVEDGSFEIVQAELQDITAVSTFVAPIVFPTEQFLYFQAREGALNVYVEMGQRVRQGDLLARLTFEMDARLELDYFAARQRLEQFEEGYAAEHSRRTAEIAAARENMADLDEDTDEDTRRQAYLQLQLLELGLQRHIFNSNSTRSTLQSQAAALSELTTGEEIVAPFDGIVTFVVSPPHNLGIGPPIVAIADDSIFFFQITSNERYNIIRHGDILDLRVAGMQEVDGVYQPLLEFDARVVTESWASGMRDEFTYWLVPVDMDSFNQGVQLIETDGLPGIHNLIGSIIRTNIEAIHVQNSLVLPTSAVRFEEPRHHYVFVYNDGRPSRRFVQVGIQVGARSGATQIISGLEAGTQVVILP